MFYFCIVFTSKLYKIFYNGTIALDSVLRFITTLRTQIGIVYTLLRATCFKPMGECLVPLPTQSGVTDKQ